MAHINQHWKRWMAVSCNHGHLGDREAIRQVLKFRAAWKPHFTAHLGDVIDTAAFRTGALGTPDEAVSPRSDASQGIEFIRLLEPDLILPGNHCWRLWKNLRHTSAIIADCAAQLIQDYKAALPKKCIFIESYDITRSWYQLGDAKLLHGFMYNENAIRDHAEHFGKCVIGHLHKVGQAAGRRADGPTAYCVGMLGDPALFYYASTRRATAQWSQGFAWGEYTNDDCIVRLVEKGRSGWRLPI